MIPFRKSRTAPATNGSDQERTTSRLKLAAGSVAILLTCFIAGLTIFFPADALQERIAYELAERSPLKVEIEGLSLNFPPSLRTERLSLDPGMEGRAPEKIAGLELRPLWSTLIGTRQGTAFEGGWRGGRFTGKAYRDGALELQLRGITIAEPLSAELPIRAEGTLAEADFSGGVPLEKETVSTLSLSLSGARVAGLGAIGSPADALSLGTISLTASGTGPSFKVDRLEAAGGDIEASGTGTILVRTPLEHSRLNLTVDLRPTPQLDRELAELLTLLVKPGRDGSLKVRIGGTLGAPRIN